MSNKQLTAAVAVAVAIACLPVSIGAECVGLPARVMKQHAALVFDGTVIKVSGIGLTHESMATIEVHRVWKGNVQKNTTVYFEEGIDGPAIEAGRRSVFFVSGQGHGSAENAPIRNQWVAQCAGMTMSNNATIKELGRARKPFK